MARGVRLRRLRQRALAPRQQQRRGPEAAALHRALPDPVAAGPVVGGGGVEADRAGPRRQQRRRGRAVDHRPRGSCSRSDGLGGAPRGLRPRQLDQCERAPLGHPLGARRSPPRLPPAAATRPARRRPRAGRAVAAERHQQDVDRRHGLDRLVDERPAEARRPDQPDRLQRRGAVDVEARRVALLDAPARRCSGAARPARPAARSRPRRSAICGTNTPTAPAATVITNSSHRRLRSVSAGPQLRQRRLARARRPSAGRCRSWAPRLEPEPEQRRERSTSATLTKTTTASWSRGGGEDGDRRQRGRRARAQQDRGSQELAEAHPRLRRSACWSRSRTPAVPSTMMSASCLELAAGPRRSARRP